MFATSRRQRGLTLVEVLVVLVLLVVLALMAVQLGTHWSNSAKASQGQASLQQAYSSARAAALQNHLAVTGDTVAASLCVTADRVGIVLGGNCSATAVWSDALAPGVVAKLAGSASCIALSNLGLPVASGSCTTSLDYSLTAGKAHVDNKKFY